MGLTIANEDNEDASIFPLNLKAVDAMSKVSSSCSIDECLQVSPELGLRWSTAGHYGNVNKSAPIRKFSILDSSPTSHYDDVGRKCNYDSLPTTMYYIQYVHILLTHQCEKHNTYYTAPCTVYAFD